MKLHWMAPAMTLLLSACHLSASVGHVRVEAGSTKPQEVVIKD